MCTLKCEKSFVEQQRNEFPGLWSESAYFPPKTKYCQQTSRWSRIYPWGTSFIDITLAGNRAHIPRWSYLAMPSLSDHPYIYFEVETSGMATLLKSPTVNKAPSLIHINQRSYLDGLALSLNKWEPHSHSFSLLSPDSIDRLIERLSSTIITCLRHARVKKQLLLPFKSMPWWSNELCALRYKARSSYKVWSRTKLPSDESLHRRSKSIYQRALRQAKCKAWADFRTPASPGDTFKA